MLLLLLFGRTTERLCVVSVVAAVVGTILHLEASLQQQQKQRRGQPWVFFILCYVVSLVHRPLVLCVSDGGNDAPSVRAVNILKKSVQLILYYKGFFLYSEK